MAEDTNSKTQLDEELAAEVERVSDNAENAEKNHKLKFSWGIIGIIAGLFVVGMIVTYAIEANKYDKIFFDATYINGIDASDKTPEEVREIIKNQCSDYEITVKSRGRDDETISASQVNLHYATDDELERILGEQNKWRFYLERHNIKSFDVPAMLDLDTALLSGVCEKLPAFDDKSAYPNVNATIGEYDPASNEYVIIPEINSNKVCDKKSAMDYIAESMLLLKKEVDIDDGNIHIYQKAPIDSTNAELLEKKKGLDTLVQTKIVFEGSDLVLDGNTINEWVIREDDDNKVSINENMLESFVKKIAGAYDTVGKERKFTSWYGNETSVSGGPYGWEVDQEEELKMLKSLIPESANVTREPVFKSRAASFDGPDWGNTYVEINLAKQHLFYIKDGELVVETDIVSGGLQRKAGTPTGVYSVAYKQFGAVLRGPRRADGTYDYESPVTYWMPFNKGIGLHDATWRGSFGGNIYKWSGSHGCVNLPKKNAKIIFENIEKGCPVVVYDDDFVVVEKEKEEKETVKETQAAKKTTTPAAKPAAQPATQPETQPETAAAEPEGQAEPTVVPIETQPEVGPGVTPLPTEQEVGPGVTQPAEPEVIENVPGGM